MLIIIENLKNRKNNFRIINIMTMFSVPNLSVKNKYVATIVRNEAETTHNNSFNGGTGDSPCSALTKTSVPWPRLVHARTRGRRALLSLSFCNVEVSTIRAPEFSLDQFHTF